MTQRVLGESLQQGMQGKSQGQLEGGIHLDRLVRTCHFLLADHLGKACLDKAQRAHQGQKEMVRLDKEQGLQVAALELLQVDNALGTGQGLRGWKGTALGLLVQDTVQVSQDQGGTHQVLTEVLGIVLVLQDQTETGTDLVLQDLMIHHCSHPEQKAGWELQGLNQAILGL